MTGLAEPVGRGDPIRLPRQPVHVHLRAHEGVYAVYATPLPLRLCADLIPAYLKERHLLLLRPVKTRWFQQQGLSVQILRHGVRLLAARDMYYIAQMEPTHLAFTDTALPPGELQTSSVAHLAVDTFTSPTWHAVIDPALGNLLYVQLKGRYRMHLLCKERSLLASVLSRFLRAYIYHHLPEEASLPDFPPLIHEQLWQYATQGWAPQSVLRTQEGMELKVALGTPHLRACVTASPCPHVSQIQRGFVLRWHDGGWDLCSTEDCHSWQP